MRIDAWLTEATKQLSGAGISTARLDCLVLLADELGRDKSWLLSHADDELQGSILEKLNTKVAQRAQHVPLAYIRGHAEFYGREFAVNPHTLVPRPETEAMIDELKAVILRHPELVSGSMRSNEATVQRNAWIPGQARNDSEITLVDIGAGSGAIAITAKLELPQARVIATDIDEKCLETARANARALGANVEFVQGNLLQPLLTTNHQPLITCLLANLPYVPDNFQINTAATHEPRRALFGGPDGLDLYRELFKQLDSLAAKPFYILTESLPPQHETLAGIANDVGYSLREASDFIQVFTAVR